MAWDRNLSRHERGYGYQWDRLRKLVLQRDQHLCQPCIRKGRATPATEVDHITPKAKGGTDDHGNLQAICSPCHKDKTTAENGGKKRLQYDGKGNPIW